ncbi:MAG: hypothetical protein Tsb0014_28630 [Pleurocapsa sp.]
MNTIGLLTWKSISLLVVATLWLFCLPTTAQTAKKAEADATKKESSESQTQTSTNQEQFDFSSTGRPGNQTAGENRGSCPNVHSSLTAIVPDSHSGQTTSAYPRFWVYMPYYAHQLSQVEFVLQDDRGRDVWRSPVNLSQSPGYINFALPQALSPLEVGRSYQWYVKVNCDPDLTSPPLYVRGWIERINLNSSLYTTLQNQEQKPYIVYARNGIWYDAIDRLLSLYTTDSNYNNSLLQQDWQQLLNSQGVTLQLPTPHYNLELVKER